MLRMIHTSPAGAHSHAQQGSTTARMTNAGGMPGIRGSNCTLHRRFGDEPLEICVRSFFTWKWFCASIARNQGPSTGTGTPCDDDVLR